MTRNTRERDSPSNTHGALGGSAGIRSVVVVGTGLAGADGSKSVSCVLHLVGGQCEDLKR